MTQTMRETWIQSLSWGRYSGEGNGNPSQYSCLGNPIDRGNWRATVYGVSRVRCDLATKSPLPPPPVHHRRYCNLFALLSIPPLLNVPDDKRFLPHLFLLLRSFFLNLYCNCLKQFVKFPDTPLLHLALTLPALPSFPAPPSPAHKLVFNEPLPLSFPLQSCVLVAPSFSTLCNLMDSSPPGSAVMRFSRREYSSGLPLPSPSDLPDPGIEPRSPTFQADCLPSEPPGKPQFSSVQWLSRVRLFATPSTAARQASLSITNSQSSPKPMSIESVMPSNHLILCRPLLLLSSIFPSIRVFSNESALRIAREACCCCC